MSMMLKLLSDWLKEYCGNKEALGLLMLNVVFFVTLLTIGQALVPIYTAIALAFLIQAPINCLSRWLPYKIACLSVFFLFLALCLTVSMLLIPFLWQQGLALTEEMPKIFMALQTSLDENVFSQLSFLPPQAFEKLLDNIQQDLTSFSKVMVQLTIVKIPSLLVLLVYAVLIPLMMLFFNLDKEKILSYCTRFLPKKRARLDLIAQRIVEQLSNYIRGKVYEIIIIGSLTAIAFQIIGLKYSFLLGFFVGLSVLIPYIGATLVTIPIVIVAYFQWGLESEFFWALGSYFVIQVLDGNLLVPLLFSEAVSLHPLVILFAVIFFGTLGGVWGVFFAIPLAAIANIYLLYWPKTSESS